MALDSYPVVWSNEAILNTESISTYIQENWTEKEVQQFFRRLEERITLISQFPRLFRKSRSHRTIRRSVLNKQTTIYYRFEHDHIEILSIFGNRQDPSKLDFKE